MFLSSLFYSLHQQENKKNRTSSGFSTVFFSFTTFFRQICKSGNVPYFGQFFELGEEICLIRQKNTV